MQYKSKNFTSQHFFKINFIRSVEKTFIYSCVEKTSENQRVSNPLLTTVDLFRRKSFFPKISPVTPVAPPLPLEYRSLQFSVHANERVGVRFFRKSC